MPANVEAEVSDWQWFKVRLDLFLRAYRSGPEARAWCEYPEDEGPLIIFHMRSKELERYGDLHERFRTIDPDPMDEESDFKGLVEMCREDLETVLERFPALRRQISLSEHVGYRLLGEKGVVFEQPGSRAAGIVATPYRVTEWERFETRVIADALEQTAQGPRYVFYETRPQNGETLYCEISVPSTSRAVSLGRRAESVFRGWIEEQIEIVNRILSGLPRLRDRFEAHRDISFELRAHGGMGPSTLCRYQDGELVWENPGPDT